MTMIPTRARRPAARTPRAADVHPPAARDGVVAATPTGAPDVVDAPRPADLAVGAALFRSLGEPSRLMILQHLLTGEHRVVDLRDHLGLAQSTVSTHLACLRDCGLVTSRPAGRATMWSLAAPERTVALLAAAEDLLGVTGSAVALCPTWGASR